MKKSATRVVTRTELRKIYTGNETFYLRIVHADGRVFALNGSEPATDMEIRREYALRGDNGNGPQAWAFVEIGK